ncbi:hypothetical protein [Phaeovulum sp. NW3]|uniref:hypothetical protein n=1 Tax=Phaeovulum sp. NW3 TaxID=2934933 RepID=UPI00201FDCFE|nr:hypothetical protein [Phaeovulum sp. NW3]MCL7465466.1 hypothetical protein [Phaeovulum sp. NW3]
MRADTEPRRREYDKPNTGRAKSQRWHDAAVVVFSRPPYPPVWRAARAVFRFSTVSIARLDPLAYLAGMIRFFDMDDRARLPWRFYGESRSILARL